MRRNNKYLAIFVMLILSVAAYSIVLPQSDNTRKNRLDATKALRQRQNRLKTADDKNAQTLKKDSIEVISQPIIEEETEIPDSLLNTRWKVQKTLPVEVTDLNQNAMDLKRPDNMKQEVTYNDTIGYYLIGNKMNGTYIEAPVAMTFQEYLKWSEQQLMDKMFRAKNSEIFETQGKEKFDFTDLHFDLGPAEKIFGPGGVRVKTQGSAELKFGIRTNNVDNPSLPIRRRKTTNVQFDEKINMNMTGSVGDKVKMNLNYNTDATFQADAQNMKLKYDGKEDEIIKLVEAGNVSFPSNSSLIRGASSLFGLRTDLQFGKLKLQAVASQKKSSSSSVSSKGGTQLTPFEMDVTKYDENRHFFLSHYFHDTYDTGMRTLPNLMTGVSINRIEVWVTNTTSNTNNTRSLIALADLGENKTVSNPIWTVTGMPTPSNQANSEYFTIVNQYEDARDVDQMSTVLDGIMTGGQDYEKLEKARLLSSSEYTVNKALGFISLKTALRPEQVLAVAYEYTYGGQTYQVGEFAGDYTDVNKALVVKALKNTSNNPMQPNWRLMMKNVYSLSRTLQKEKFKLDIKFQSDTAGVYLSYIPEPQVKSQTLIKLLGADRLDNNNKPNANGYFDYVEGYTVSNGCIFLPAAEPFGNHLLEALVKGGVAMEKAKQYAFTELYDSTTTVAKQIAEKNKFLLQGQYKGSAENVISVGASHIPQGSVVVTAGGVLLTEGSDYTVDYSMGEVTILNQSIIDAGTNINVSVESNSDYGQMRKTMFGLNWEYDFSKNFQMSGTIQHLSEQAITTKVSMGSEPLNNTLWGLNMNWKKESQWLTDMLNYIPLLHVTQPSNISFTGEFAHLIAGQSHGTQDNASYLDDFENTKTTNDQSTPSAWFISSVPTMFPESQDKNTLRSGFNRSLLSWYYIDPIFTRRSSSLTPSHIKSDLDQLSNHYVREIYVRELYPNRDQSSYNGATSTLSVLNLAYYPNERGPYNFSTDVNYDGTLRNPRDHWGGMMRKIDHSDFEAQNIEYLEFWMLDPFIYTREQGVAQEYGGDFYINLGECSEDILRDGKKFYESGMPVDGTSSFTTTQWGKIPVQATTTYAFATTSGSREKQDVGFNGLTDEEERTFETYQDFLSEMQGKVSAAVWDSLYNDPANDNYHYFRGTDYDRMEASILRRYKYINNPQGNSPDTSNRTESYDTSYKTTPDVEDINQDYTLNEYEKYYQYHVSIRPEDFVVGQNHIVDKRESSWTLRNGNTETVNWYQFRIPIKDWESKVGNVNDFTSIRFMRMFMTNFKNPIVLRFATLDLVRGDWRVYEQNLDNVQGAGKMSVSAVNIEENNDKTPVNYTLPPGIRREQDPQQRQLVESNEQALAMTVSNLATGESKAVYKNITYDMRQYKRLQMFVHANAMEQNITNLADQQLSIFVRLGSDYKSNYYEYEIPLTLTPPGRYDRFSYAGCRAVWPQENMLDIALSVFTDLKKERNKAKALGQASYNRPFSAYDSNRPQNKVTVMGNPTLGEVKTMVIGVRNNAGEQKSGEVWVNELRLLEYNNEGGWAAQGNLNVQLSDFGTVNMQGRYTSHGFGGLEEGVMQRSNDDYKQFQLTTSLELGKFFPDKAKVSAPLYYSVSTEENRPKYNPLDSDMRLSDALESATKQEKDSIESLAITRTVNKNFSLSNVRIGIQNKKHPTPVDPANFSFSYAHSHKHSQGETTVFENEDNWRGSINYAWTPVYKSLEPFKKIKSKSKWYDILKKFSLNYMPQNVSANTDMTRNYYELQERDVESLENSQLPLTFSEQFLWNRDFSLRWDLTKNIHMNFQSATHAEIEEPYTPINKDLYPDHYDAWKDSVMTSIRHFGTPLDYKQSFSLSYQLPLNLLPCFDWLNSDASFKSTYGWVRGSDLEDGTSLGNNITSNRDISLNGTMNMEKLYNHIPFLKKTNERFNKTTRTTPNRKDVKAIKTPKGKPDGKDGANDKEKELKDALPKNKNSVEKELSLKSDTTTTFNHGKKSKRLLVSARTEDGKIYPIKYKVKDDNNIIILNKVDSTLKIKVSVTAKQPLEELSWYKVAQSAARVAMMLRNVNISYRNQQSMALPGFMPNAGDAFGQNKVGGAMAPGLDFAFGIADYDKFLQKARDMDWLLFNDQVATPATMSKTEDLQLKFTLEPVKNFKIDLNASRAQTRGRSIQYMYQGNPTTETGTFTMTTISLSSAFEGMGNANNGYHSRVFERFCQSLPKFQQRVEAQYAGAHYPAGTSMAGASYDPQNGGVDAYSSDVMIPAFLSAYTASGGGLQLFPTIAKILPNWTIKYSGLSKVAWFKDHFKSVNINHAYKSVYAVGSYSSYSTFMEYMNGLGFIENTTTGTPVPSSKYNISTVSINEAFSPLLGLDLTFLNNMTCKVEYKTTRVLTLSTTSVQINEALSRDWVIGWGYKIQGFNLFSASNHRKVKSNNKQTGDDAENSQKNNAKNNTAAKGKNQVNHDLNLRCDLSYRQQAAISRDIASMTSSASSGNTAFSIKFNAEYTLSKLMSMSFYYDRQMNKPLLSSNSYPTTTQDFGLSIKFSLTR